MADKIITNNTLEMVAGFADDDYRTITMILSLNYIRDLIATRQIGK